MRTPNFEPRRGAELFRTPGGAAATLTDQGRHPFAQVTDWMVAVEGCASASFQMQMSQKDLRQWKRKHKSHRSFTVLQHPVARAHHVFCDFTLGGGPRVFGAIRRKLINRYELTVPIDAPDES